MLRLALLLVPSSAVAFYQTTAAQLGDEGDPFGTVGTVAVVNELGYHQVAL